MRPLCRFAIADSSVRAPTRSALLAWLCVPQFFIVTLVLPVSAPASEEIADEKVAVYRDALAERLAPQAQSALDRIVEPRRLLALRAYLRAGEHLTNRWSWSEEQIKAFGQTREYWQLIAAVEQVRGHFEADNPGYTLYANTDVRSLDVQVDRWNRNDSVGKVAASIQRAVRKELLKSHYPDQPDTAALDRLAQFIHQWPPPRAAALAAPGLSKHGQLRAIDFAILKDGKIVVPTNLAAAEPVWERQGWSEKLKRATVDTPFTGPLQTPNEPWHYEYTPPARDVKVVSK